MIDIEATCTRRGGVTRVRATVTNERSTPQRVTVESTLEGPVWPPVSDPIVVPEWSDGVWTGVVPPSRSRGVGFATSAAPAADPVSVSSIDRADPESAARGGAIVDLEPASPPSSIVSTDR